MRVQEQETAATDRRREVSGTVREPAPYLLIPAFAVVAFLMTFRSVGNFDTHIVGNSGDPLLILWILGWVQHAIPHGWGEIWNTSMFVPHDNTLAFSDSMISVAIVDWPLRALFGKVVSLNLLMLAAQTASLWFMYRLALRLTRSWPAAVVAALIYAFSSIMLSHVAFYQLTLTAFVIPLMLLLLVRYLEHWRVRDGIGVGLTFAALTTSATYFGLMMACAIPVIVVGYVIWYRPTPLWQFVKGLAAGAVVASVITLPVAIQYTQLQDDSYFRRGFDSEVAAHPSDFLAPSIDNYLLADVWPFEGPALDRAVENHLFPGMLAAVFGAFGLVVLVRRVRRGTRRGNGSGGPGPPTPNLLWRSRVAILIAGAGLTTLLLAFGDEVYVGDVDVPMPFKVLRKFVPGFSGIRATSRFAVMTSCALALCAGFGVAALFRRTGRRATTVILVALCAIVLLESAVKVPLVRVPGGRIAESVSGLLDDRPDGVVAELPIRGVGDGTAWAYLESPRQLASLGDANDRVNGYSGYAPEGFDDVVQTLNGFPSPASLRELDRLDVRYVVLRTEVVGEQLPPFDEMLETDGYGRYAPSSARARIAEIPPERVRRVTPVTGAYVVELRPGS